MSPRSLEDKQAESQNGWKSSLRSPTLCTGSVVERFGISLMISKQRGCCGRLSCRIGALNTDLEIMFFTLEDKASNTGEESIQSWSVLLTRVVESGGFTGCANLINLTADIDGEVISSKRARVITKSAVENTHVFNFPGKPPYCGICEDTPRVHLNSKGPTMKLPSPWGIF